MSIFKEKSILINSNSKDAKKELQKFIRKQLKNIAYDEICVACIGTDRSTGDSLGPLVGYKLNKEIKVVGTLDNPLHAKNIHEFAEQLSPSTYVIAVDACLGKMDHVGYLQVGKGPIRPGAGVGKQLSPIGDMHIAGIVNFGGFMDFLVLQNTRLSVVMKMADLISDVLNKSLKKEVRKCQRLN